MRIAVIAANGRTGRAFVEAALAAGYTIRAGVFGGSDLSPHPHLTTMTCDGTNIEDVRRVLQGQDAVVSLIGHIKGSPASVQTDTISNVIVAMNELGIQRLISLTGTGVRFEGDHISMLDRLLNLAIRIIDPLRIKDGIEHAEQIKQSRVDWTIIRVLKLQNGALQTYSLPAHGPARLLTARATVASAIVMVLEENSFIHQSPVIGK